MNKTGNEPSKNDIIDNLSFLAFTVNYFKRSIKKVFLIYFVFSLFITKYRTTFVSNFNMLQKFVMYFGKLKKFI